MPVVNVWIGGTTPTSAQVRARVDGATARLGWSTSPLLEGMQWTAPVSPSLGMVAFTAAGLEPGTRYFYAVEVDGVLDAAAAGQFVTHPPIGAPASFTYGMATCAGSVPSTPATGAVLNPNRISNSPVFDVIRERALAEGWLGWIHGGDLHYYDIGSGVHVDGHGTDVYRRAYDDVLLQPRQAALYRSVSTAYVWDDHDYGPNDSDRTAPGRAAAAVAYRERVPHYPLPASSGPIYQSWQVGRVLFVASDVRYDRDPNSAPDTAGKTMLGSTQKAWLEQLLATTPAEALVWVNPSQWSSVHADSWASFTRERAELTQMFGDLGWLHRMCILSGDAHALSIDTGRGNASGNFPIYQFSSLDSGGTAGPVTDTGPNLPGPLNYGTLTVADSGRTIAVTGTGYQMATPWRSHTWYVHTGRHILSLDYRSDVAPPLEPTDDDQATRNDITAKRPDGGEARVEVIDGPLGIDAVGRYDESADVAVDRDEQLIHQAGWRAHMGTVDQARYPTVRLNLMARPGLIAGAADLEPGDRMVIDHPPAWLPPDAIDLLAEGYSEVINTHTWDVEVNASPGEPYHVATLPPHGTEPGDVGPAEADRADTGGSQLAAAVSETGTSLVVHTPQTPQGDRARWITSAGGGENHPAEFPFDVRLGGETARVTACEPLVWDDFTTARTGGWGTAPSGVPWIVDAAAATSIGVSTDNAYGFVQLDADPGVVRFARADSVPIADCEAVWSVRVNQTSSGSSLLPSLLLRRAAAGDYYRCRLHLNTDGTCSLSVTRGTAQIGATVNLPRTVYTPGTALGQRVLVRTRIIGDRVLARAWAATEETEPHRWQIDRTIPAADSIATGQLGFTASAFTGYTGATPSLRFQLLELTTPQRMTVQRSVNTVTRAHAAGTPVRLARPAYAGL